MVKQFQFARIPGIIFRQGGLMLIPDLLGSYGNRVVLVTGRRSFLSSFRASNLTAALSSRKIEVRTIIIGGEPSPEVIDRNVAGLREFRPDVVVAVGGGSVLDAGKAISAMLTVEGTITGYLEGIGKKEHPGTKIPFIAVPTTSGTGSEATKNAVISRTGPGGFKRSLRHDNFVPDIALIDPELTLECPASITAASGMDCFTQLTEAYLSTKPTEYTDALALEGLKAVKKSLYASYSDGRNLEARADMAFAALTSGICLANAGLGTVHGFASSIGGMFNIPHGVVCGTLMASANEANVKKLVRTGSNPAAMKKYAALGSLFCEKEGSNEYLAQCFIEYLYDMTSRLNLPVLKSFGLKKADLGTICSATDNKNNPVPLDQDELLEVISKRYT